MNDFRKQETGIIIVSGPPGSGKGAMSQDYVAQTNRVKHISAGELVRKIRAGEIESDHSSILQDALKNRVLMPDETFADIIIEKIVKSGDDIDLSLIDGFPQGIGDWEHFNNVLKKYRFRIIGAICLMAKEETCVERMKFRGMREGEEIRIQHSNLEEYYKDRYRKYMARYHKIEAMLESKNVKTELFDADQNIIDDGIRQQVSTRFSQSISKLIQTSTVRSE